VLKEKSMDIDSVVAELRNKADSISRALAALSGVGTTPRRKRSVRTAKRGKSRAKRRGGLTAAGRKRLSMLMKKRWAARKKAGSKKL